MSLRLVMKWLKELKFSQFPLHVTPVRPPFGPCPLQHRKSGPMGRGQGRVFSASCIKIQLTSAPISHCKRGLARGGLDRVITALPDGAPHRLSMQLISGHLVFQDRHPPVPFAHLLLFTRSCHVAFLGADSVCVQRRYLRVSFTLSLTHVFSWT